MRRLHPFLRNEYGGSRGFFTHLQAIALHRLGRWEKHRQIDLRAVKRFLFVCQGNVCRSPYAAARARAAGLPAIFYGLDVRKETQANTQAQAEALKHGVDLNSHRSRAFEPGHGSRGDLLIGMEPSHLIQLATRHADEESLQITLLGLWAKPPRPHIQDPFGQSPEYFNRCFQIIDAGVATLVELWQCERERESR
jgi:protein-tyrosine phosphatase